MQISKTVGIIEKFKGMKIKVYYSTGDPVSFSEGILEDHDSDGMLLKYLDTMIFVPWASVVCFETES